MSVRPLPDFLAHLRRDRRGLPVPYINRWGPEDTDRYTIQYDPNVGGPGIFDYDNNETVPDFTAQNYQRQRKCMVQGLCQVCARQIPWSRRFLVVSGGISVENISIGGRKVAVVIEPWLDQRCAEFALTTCPALIRRRTAEGLLMIPITSKQDTQLIGSVGWVEGHLEAESKRIRPSMWVKLALLGVNIELRDTLDGGAERSDLNELA